MAKKQANFNANSDENPLIRSAELYHHQGYAVIPVWGDKSPERAKVAAIPWKDYRHRRPSLPELHHWFGQQRYGGLALITGMISRLVVLDFDDPALADRFELQLPHLTRTRTIRSAGRGLPHYYFHVPTYLHVESRRAPGADLQSDGRYVIAPPTAGYQVIRGGQPLTLDKSALKALYGFLDAAVAAARPRYAVLAPVKQPPEPLPEVVPPQPTISLSDLVTVYRMRASHGGRNQSLFRVALQARDAGYPRELVEQKLVDVHAAQQSHEKPAESILARRAEARRTIASVYSRPPRRPRLPQTSVLPNTLREALVQRGQTHVLRVIEGLRLLGSPTGELNPLTEREIREKLTGVVGRHSILHALKSTYPDGKSVFHAVSDHKNPSPTPPTHTAVASDACGRTNKKCFLFRASESDKNRRGRPAVRYIVPDVATLCAGFGVDLGVGDALRVEDLRSAGAYRASLNRELLRRRPGTYSRRWLSRRIGVSVRTWQRYCRATSVRRSPDYQQTPLHWHNLNVIPQGMELGGACLQDDQGKRYPAVMAIARRLLAKGRRVSFLLQQHNHYWVDAPPVILPAMASESREKCPIPRFLPVSGQVTANKPSEGLKSPEKHPSTRDLPIAAAAVLNPPMPPQVPVSSPVGEPAAETMPAGRETRRRYRRPLTDTRLEALAQRLYETVRALCQEGVRTLSLVNARRLVSFYPLRLIHNALHVLKQRASIQNPAGFLVTFLRSEYKLIMT